MKAPRSVVWVSFCLIATAAQAADVLAPSRAEDASITSPLAGALEGATIEASSDAKVARLKVGSRFGTANHQVELRVEVPIEEGKAATNLVSLDGLAGTNSLAAAWSFAQHFAPSDAGSKQDVLCRNYLAAHEIDANKEGVDCGTLDTILKVKGPSTDDKAALEQSWDDVSWGPVCFLTLQGRVGRKSYAWRDALDLVSHKESLSGTAATLQFATLFPNDVFLGLGYRREHALKEQSKVQLCTPYGSTGVLKCESSALGAPIREEADVLTTELRVRRGSAAAKLEVQFDCRSHAWSAYLPLYFLRNDASGLTGGVAGRWRSDPKDSSVALFVGTAFELF